MSKCSCPSCKDTQKQLSLIERKLQRISDVMENKENLSKLQLEQMLLATRLFEIKFFALSRSIKVMTKDDHDAFLVTFNQLREKLYDLLALIDTRV
jgi:hypothetical protein